MAIVAAIQMCSSHNVEDNLREAGQWIQKAAKSGAKLVVLPEMFALFGATTTEKLKQKEQEGLGKLQLFLSTQARENKIWLIGGTIPLEAKNTKKIRAACLAFDDNGNLRARYDKINLFDVTLSSHEKYLESETTEGGDTIVLVNTPVGKIGLAICYDLRFPEIFQRLITHGAEIIVAPSAFTVSTGKDHWELLAKSTALTNFCYFIGACQGGTHHAKRTTWGHSLIVSPWGKIIAEKLDDKPGIVLANIDIDYLKKVRNSIPALANRKTQLHFKYYETNYN